MHTDTTKPANAEVTDTLVDIKRVAKNTGDVQAWLAANVGLLGITPPDDIRDVEVSVSLSLRNTLSEEPEGIPVVKAYASISVSNNAKVHPSMRSILSLNNPVESTVTSNFRLYMSFDEWPFLTSHTAIMALLKQAGYITSEALLEHYVPKHFPGMTWTALKGLYANELLPALADGSLDEPGVQNLLFGLRERQDVALRLPDTLSV